MKQLSTRKERERERDCISITVSFKHLLLICIRPLTIRRIENDEMSCLIEFNIR